MDRSNPLVWIFNQEVTFHEHSVFHVDKILMLLWEVSHILVGIGVLHEVISTIVIYGII